MYLAYTLLTQDASLGKRKFVMFCILFVNSIMQKMNEKQMQLRQRMLKP